MSGQSATMLQAETAVPAISVMQDAHVQDAAAHWAKAAADLETNASSEAGSDLPEAMATAPAEGTVPIAEPEAEACDDAVPSGTAAALPSPFRPADPMGRIVMDVLARAESADGQDADGQDNADPVAPPPAIERAIAAAEPVAPLPRNRSAVRWRAPGLLAILGNWTRSTVGALSPRPRDLRTAREIGRLRNEIAELRNSIDRLVAQGGN